MAVVCLLPELIELLRELHITLRYDLAIGDVSLNEIV